MRIYYETKFFQSLNVGKEIITIHLQKNNELITQGFSFELSFLLKALTAKQKLFVAMKEDILESLSQAKYFSNSQKLTEWRECLNNALKIYNMEFMNDPTNQVEQNTEFNTRLKGEYKIFLIFNLLNIKLAFSFCEYYNYRNLNIKVFEIFQKIYQSSGYRLDLYIQLLIKYQLIHRAVYNIPEQLVYQAVDTNAISFLLTCCQTNDRHYVFNNYLIDCSKILKVCEIERFYKLGFECNLGLKKYSNCKLYASKLLFIYSSFRVFEIIITAKTFEEALIKNLNLNNEILNALTMLIKSLILLGESYEKIFYYCLIFMFVQKNSIQLINDSDPVRFIKKGTNSLQLTNETYESRLNDRQFFQKILLNSNQQFSSLKQLIYKAMSLNEIPKFDYLENRIITCKSYRISDFEDICKQENLPLFDPSLGLNYIYLGLADDSYMYSFLINQVNPKLEYKTCIKCTSFQRQRYADKYFEVGNSLDTHFYAEVFATNFYLFLDPLIGRTSNVKTTANQIVRRTKKSFRSVAKDQNFGFRILPKNVMDSYERLLIILIKFHAIKVKMNNLTQQFANKVLEGQKTSNDIISSLMSRKSKFKMTPQTFATYIRQKHCMLKASRQENIQILLTNGKYIPQISTPECSQFKRQQNSIINNVCSKFNLELPAKDSLSILTSLKRKRSKSMPNLKYSYKKIESHRSVPNLQKTFKKINVKKLHKLKDKISKLLFLSTKYSLKPERQIVDRSNNLIIVCNKNFIGEKVDGSKFWFSFQFNYTEAGLFLHIQQEYKMNGFLSFPVDILLMDNKALDTKIISYFSQSQSKCSTIYPFIHDYLKQIFASPGICMKNKKIRSILHRFKLNYPPMTYNYQLMASNLLMNNLFSNFTYFDFACYQTVKKFLSIIVHFLVIVDNFQPYRFPFWNYMTSLQTFSDASSILSLIYTSMINDIKLRWFKTQSLASDLKILKSLVNEPMIKLSENNHNFRLTIINQSIKLSPKDIIIEQITRFIDIARLSDQFNFTHKKKTMNEFLHKKIYLVENRFETVQLKLQYNFWEFLQKSDQILTLLCNLRLSDTSDSFIHFLLLVWQKMFKIKVKLVGQKKLMKRTINICRKSQNQQTMIFCKRLNHKNLIRSFSIDILDFLFCYIENDIRYLFNDNYPKEQIFKFMLDMVSSPNFFCKSASKIEKVLASMKLENAISNDFSALYAIIKLDQFHQVDRLRFCEERGFLKDQIDSIFHMKRVVEQKLKNSLLKQNHFSFGSIIDTEKIQNTDKIRAYLEYGSSYDRNRVKLNAMLPPVMKANQDEFKVSHNKTHNGQSKILLGSTTIKHMLVSNFEEIKNKAKKLRDTLDKNDNEKIKRELISAIISESFDCIETLYCPQNLHPKKIEFMKEEISKSVAQFEKPDKNFNLTLSLFSRAVKLTNLLKATPL